MTTTNQFLADELEAINSIYEFDTLAITTTSATHSQDNASTTTILTLPSLPFSFTITFPAAYPDVPPLIKGIQSTGANTKKGDGEAALSVLRDVLGTVYVPGQVCLFDLIEEVTPLLTSSSPTGTTTLDASDVAVMDDDVKPNTAVLGPLGAGTGVESSNRAVQHLTSTLSDLHIQALPSSTSSSKSVSKSTHRPSQEPESVSEPAWILSDPLSVSKSTFIALCLPVNTLTTATDAISHLLSTNKRVAAATHNITAWRIRIQNSNPDGAEITIQDCDDDGETAAGGRLLHLMQLMGVWNCVVVVTRWYGGVKLGADRFRCINLVAREAMVRGGFGHEDTATGEKEKGKGKKGRKGKGD